MLIDGLLTQPPALQSICKTLMILDLQNNYITHIDELYFAGCIKLSTLSFHRNMLLSMPDISYMAHTLTTLDLSRNQLSGTYLYFVKLFHRLHTIHLHFNYLTAFCMQQIKYLPFIGFISLNNNNITYVKFDYLPDRQGRLLNKIFLTMYNNPLQCDRDWNNTCDNRRTRPDLLCGDYIQLKGIRCTNNTGRLLKFDNHLRSLSNLIQERRGRHLQTIVPRELSMICFALWKKMFSNLNIVTISFS